MATKKIVEPVNKKRRGRPPKQKNVMDQITDWAQLAALLAPYIGKMIKDKEELDKEAVSAQAETQRVYQQTPVSNPVTNPDAFEYADNAYEQRVVSLESGFKLSLVFEDNTLGDVSYYNTSFSYLLSKCVGISQIHKLKRVTIRPCKYPTEMTTY